MPHRLNLMCVVSDQDLGRYLVLIFRRVRKIAISASQLRHVCVSVRPSARNNSAPTGRISVKSNISIFFFWNLSRKFKIHQHLAKIRGTLHEDQYTFWIISHSVLLRIKNVSDKSCREYEATHFVSSNYFGKLYRFEIMCKNIEEPGRSQMTVWRVRITCWISQTTNTFSDNVTLVVV